MLDERALGHELVGRHAERWSSAGIGGQAEDAASHPEREPDDGKSQPGRVIWMRQAGREARQADIT